MRTRIRELRKLYKLTQEELADAVGTTRQTITSIETGKYIASLPLAYRIAREFGLRIEDVFMLEEEDEYHRQGSPWGGPASMTCPSNGRQGGRDAANSVSAQ